MPSITTFTLIVNLGSIPIDISMFPLQVQKVQSEKVASSALEKHGNVSDHSGALGPHIHSSHIEQRRCLWTGQGKGVGDDFVSRRETAARVASPHVGVEPSEAPSQLILWQGLSAQQTTKRELLSLEWRKNELAVRFWRLCSIFCPALLGLTHYFAQVQY